MDPRTVAEIIKDFKGRRAGILKALTNDIEEFYQLCDPNNSNLCLYGFPDQQWEVSQPRPSDLPVPRLGISLGRNTMKKHEWLSMVAFHSDAWLYAIASYFAAKLNFGKADKKRLFDRITDVSSICEVLGVQKTAGGGLPEHILVEEVFVRLPLRDLLKYRSVCKTWRSLIDDPEFISIHLENYKHKYEGNHLLVLSRPKRVSSGGQVFVHDDTSGMVLNLANIVYHEGTYLSYVNGLILVEVVKGHSWSSCKLVLWNPSINRSLTVDIVPVSMCQGVKKMSYFELGLGYDASCDDYKVIAIVYPHYEHDYCKGHYRAIVPGFVQVYKLSTGFWSSNLGITPPPYWKTGGQVFANGAIHWTNLGPNVADDVWDNKDDLYIVSFDVKIEAFNYFELPSVLGIDKPKEKLPTVLGGSLALFCSYSESRCDIWVMGEYGKSDSWSKRYTFTLVMDELLHFKNNGELVFVVNGEGIKSYNVKIEKVRDLAITYSTSSRYKVFTYIESLVLSREVKRRPFESGFYKDSTPVSGSDISLVVGGSNYG